MTNLRKSVQNNAFADKIQKFVPAGKFLLPEKTDMGHFVKETTFFGYPEPRHDLADSRTDEADIHEIQVVATFESVLHRGEDHKNIVFLDLETCSVEFDLTFALCYKADPIKRKNERTFIYKFTSFTHKIQRGYHVGKYS